MHTTDYPRARSFPSLTVALFTATIFLSASLLFFVQPMFAKIVLPVIGGAPAVWTTAMLFFQSVLLAGYVYAHLSTRYLRPRQQMLLHLGLWAVALAFLPLGIPEGWLLDIEGPVAPQTLWLFALGVGVPFGVLSANAPLIQSWYARTDGPSADDPYFLYGASNLGSLAALLAFPLVAEPLFGITDIGWGWMLGFLALGAFLALSGWRAGQRRPGAQAAPATRADQPLTGKQVALWLLLAFVPSSLMLSVTTKISTDIGAIPLVWVIPLSLYLLTFVLTFTRSPFLSIARLRILAMVGVGALAAAYLGFAGPQVRWGWVAVITLAFFAVALFSHRLLYEARPGESRLTEFYVTMSVGGALGGLFNSIVAPLAFDTLYEGPITVLIAAMLLVGGWRRITPRLAVLAVALGAVCALGAVTIARNLSIGEPQVVATLVLGLALPVVLMLRRRPPAAAMAVAAGLVAGMALAPDGALHRDRSFFGAHLVAEAHGLRVYTHGTTIHGAQRSADFEAERPEPLFYYHPNAPMAQILTSPRGQEARRIGVVGQGVGSLACYAQPGQDWAFYEIDPVVDRIARDPDLFGFMQNCAGDAPTFLGDARVVLDQQDGRLFDILVIDAFSSDAIPVHLTTREALELYMDRLAPGGLLVFHISNIYFDLTKPLSRSAEALGLTAWLQNYRGNRGEDAADTPSMVMALARDPGDFGALAADSRWMPVASDGGPVWTDEHANLLSVLKGGFGFGRQ